MVERLILIRHGALADACAGRYIGRTDVPLSAVGRSQARALGRCRHYWPEARVFISPLSRCRETATLALDGKGSFTVDKDLREIDFGRWEGMTFAQIAALDPAAVDRWAALEEDFTFPEGEGLVPFRQRVAEAASRVSAAPGETAVTVTHGGVIRFLICHFLGLTLRDHLLFTVDPASVSEIRIEGGRGVLTLLNDRHHLEIP
ncbi:MAG: histidine phosphatase family protein [Syntrophaceae bacterium]|nr:histidine phosphatase family protein [Syntrophaceae bacterium]